MCHPTRAGNTALSNTASRNRVRRAWVLGMGLILGWTHSGMAIDPEPPASPYARYHAEAGITIDGSGHISLWETQTATAHDLDRISGSASAAPLTLARSGGGTGTVAAFDGTGGLWAAAGDWGAVSGDRTVMARVRVGGTDNGFLFDGSTRSGKSRAQVRDGMWQVGVQSSGASFSSPDPDTGPITANTWQSHIFQYDEDAEETLITHWIDGIQVGSHTVAVNTAQGGFIVGTDGAQGNPLKAEIAEILVYDRLLSSGEQTDALNYLSFQWGDLVDLPYTYQTGTVSQIAATIPPVGVHGVTTLALSSIGNLPSYALTGLTYHLNGTTSPGDITEVRLYSSGTSAVFNPSQATLLASAPPPASGPGSFSFNAPITATDHHFWIAVELSGASVDGDIIDAGITSFTIDGAQAGTYIPEVTEPPEFLTVGNTFSSVIIRQGGDDGSSSYRIPGLATSTNGTLLAVFDIRWNGSGDLPGNIDVGLRRSTDGGFTWSPMQVIMDYDVSVTNSNGNGVGDPSILVDRGTGRIWCAALWSKGNKGWNGSDPGLTPDETGQFVVNYSDDDGLTWSDPISLTPQIKDPAWNLYLQGPGKGICTREGTLIFPAQYKDGNAVPRSNFIWSTDHGTTWHTAAPAIPSGSPWTTEAQIVELDTGDLLISMRNHDGRKERLWCIYGWDHDTETIADGAWGTPWFSQRDPTVMASVQRYRSTLDGHPWSGVLFANPDNPGGRSKMSIRLSLDEGQTWPYTRKIDDRPAGYSCLTLLPDGDIGLLYETGDSSSIATLTFARFPLEWIVGTTDTDLDQIPDFHEDVLGLDKNDPNDAADDPDLDRMTSREEFVARTLPFSEDSVLRAAIQAPQAEMTRVSWSAVPYVVYHPESTVGLDPATWAPVPGMESIRATSTDLTLDIPTSAPDPTRYFRIAVP